MDTFAASQGGIKKARRRILTQSAPLMLLGLAVPLGISYFKGAPAKALLIILPLFGFIIYRALRRSRKQLDETLSSLRIILDGDTLTRRQSGLEDISIQRSEVTAIYESRARGLTVRTRVRSTFVGIPSLLDRYEELRDRLSSWQPIVEKRIPPQLAPYASALGVLALFGIFLLSQNRRVVVACGVLLFLLMLASSMYIRRSRHINQRVKMPVWAVVFVLAIIVLRLYLVLQ